jgi:hypothetical protein
MTLNLDFDAIRSDLQHVAILQEAADAIVEGVEDHTSVNVQPARGEVEMGPDGPFVTIGAKAAAAVSVEFGTRYRRASAPIRRAALALGFKVPN